MRFVTWNINSLRLRLALLLQVIDKLNPDVVCLQEIKCPTEAAPVEALVAGGFPHVLVEGMKGYNGVAILSRYPMTRIAGPNWCGRDDARHICARISVGGSDITVDNLYVPAGGDVPDPQANEKFAHKLQFLDEGVRYLSATSSSERRLLAGDLNIAPLETDVWSHRQLLDVVSHTPVEVAALARWQATRGWVDTTRQVLGSTDKLYSWWSYRAKDWDTSDRGRRLDHVWASPALAPAVTGAGILREARGWTGPSDHVPVWTDIAFDAPAPKASRRRTA
ncbi:MAG: endonuclease/exonuclease/phosphatase family protein [Alphaproteobacteria bacterium]|nr:endonuclease/exonuclease/phosphatase family protein [Alphaproteobacteria bacterium]